MTQRDVHPGLPSQFDPLSRSLSTTGCQSCSCKIMDINNHVMPNPDLNSIWHDFHDLLLDQPCFFLAPPPNFLFITKIALNILSYPTFATNNQILGTQHCFVISSQMSESYSMKYGRNCVTANELKSSKSNRRSERLNTC